MSAAADCGSWSSDDIPSSWEWADFGEVWDDLTDSKKKLKQKEYLKEGPLAVVDQGETFVGGYTDDLSLQSEAQLPCVIFGDHSRAVKFIDFPFAQGADGVKVLVPTPVLDPEFAYLSLRCLELPNKGYSRHFKFLKASSFPIPPLAEQRRIVEKLDQLSARTRAAKDHLTHVQTLATRAKQATLAAAFRGELLGLEIVQTHQMNDRCWDLPEGWAWKRFDEVATIKSNLRPPSEMQELPHIAPDNVEGGTGCLLPYRTIAEDGVKSGKHHFFPGQIIYSKIRPYLRKAVTVDFEGACSADMYPIECGADYDRGLLLQWLISEDFAWFTSEHEGRSVLPKINQKALNSTPVPVPPIEQQTEIVRRVETAFARIDRMVTAAAKARALLERLEQQLLAKAFRGELVPQDPSDEPASALLARIREARANAPKPKRTRKKT